MDFLASDAWKKYFENKDTKILMLGLDEVGKSTILQQFHLSDHILAKQLIVGFNPEILDYKGFNIISWDLPGGDRFREFWRKYYYPKTKGIIYVVDSSDSSRLEQSIEELCNIEELKESIVLVFLNKNDQPNTISEEDFQKKLNFESLKNRTFKIQKSAATTSEGLYEGINWLGENISNKFK